MRPVAGVPQLLSNRICLVFLAAVESSKESGPICKSLSPPEDRTTYDIRSDQPPGSNHINP